MRRRPNGALLCNEADVAQRPSANVWMRRAAWLTLLLVGCDGLGRAHVPSSPRPTTLTDDAACDRLCDRLEGCGGAPARCRPDCERDRARLREGFSASFVGCVEHELGPAVCGPLSRADARSGAIAMCYAATLDVWAERDRGVSLRRVLKATCRHRARCVPGAAIEEQRCMRELEPRAAISGKLLAVAQPSLVERAAACVESSGCDDDDALVTRCSQTPKDGVPFSP